jgi:hypothetical protein
MTNQEKYVSYEELKRRLERTKWGAIYTSVIMGALVIGTFRGCDTNRFEKRDVELESAISNLTERVNFYHGTNWNYTSQKNEVKK